MKLDFGRGAHPTTSAFHPSGPDISEDDPRVVRALEEYLAAIEAGHRPERREFLGRFPEIAAALAACLDGLELVRSAADHFQDAPDLDATPAIAGTITPPPVLGDFRIVREVGRGGMGVVYEAEQISLGRRVALKVLPFAAAIDPKQLARFRVEAQAAAALHHARIVPVFAVGTDRGIPYYAMQFIDGRSLATVIQELRDAEARAARTVIVPAGKEAPPTSSGLGAPPTISTASHPTEADPADSRGSGSSGSSTGPRDGGFFRTIARQGVQAAEALEHAHSLGVLHRDIKPANLMLDADGDLWVTDFGLARLPEDAGLTRTGDLLGTLRYMSPEQALARRVVVDQRTDIYSLGATLYELATLRPAFDGRDRQELLRQIALEEPPAPRRLNKAVPRDLETIILKAMAKEPAARYATAQDLADDLGRFLDDRPIQARRPSPPERLGRWARRHRPAVATALAVFALAAAVGVALLYHEKTRTQAALNQLKNSLRFTVFSSDQITFQAMAVLASGDVQKLDKSYSSFYAEGLKFYEQVAAGSRGDPALRIIRATALQRVGFIRMILRYKYQDNTIREADVLDAYEQSLALYRALAAEPKSSPETRRDMVDVIKDIARTLDAAGKPLEAERRYREALAIQRGLVADFPMARIYVTGLNQGQFALVDLLTRTGRRPEADRAIRELLEWYEHRLDVPATMPGAGSATLFGFAQLGHDLSKFGRYAEAARIYDRIVKLMPRDPKALNNLAWFLVNCPDRTERDPARAIELAESALAPKRTWELLNTLGVAHYRAGHWDAARQALEEGMTLNRGGTPHDWLFLAMVFARQGRRPEALRWFERAAGWIASREAAGTDPDLPELLRFRAEAEEVLQLDPHPPVCVTRNPFPEILRLDGLSQIVSPDQCSSSG